MNNMKDNDLKDVILPEREDYRAEIEQAIRETRQVIKEAQGYIDRQEDGPLTMKLALRDIDRRVMAIEAEASYQARELMQTH